MLNIIKIHKHFFNTVWIFCTKIMSIYLITCKPYVMCCNFFFLMSDIVSYVWHIFQYIGNKCLHFINIFWMKLNIFQINLEHYKNAHWTLSNTVWIFSKKIMSIYLITCKHYVMCCNLFFLMSDIVSYVWHIFQYIANKCLHFMNIFSDNGTYI